MIRQALPILFLWISSISYSQPVDSSSIMISSAFYIPTETIVIYELADTKIPIRVSQYGNRRDIVYVNLHDNEATSVQAARALLEQQGGTLIRIENGNERMIRFRFRGKKFIVDPNRIFSREGIERSLNENRCYAPWVVVEIEKFGQRILDMIPEKISCIVALHNNTEGNYSIKNYLPGGDRISDVRAVQFQLSNDRDDIALTTDEGIYRAMAAAGFNTIWQDNGAVKKDGSLSVYCGLRGLRYINIETEHGRVESYILMLDKLFKYLERD